MAFSPCFKALKRLWPRPTSRSAARVFTHRLLHTSAAVLQPWASSWCPGGQADGQALPRLGAFAAVWNLMSSPRFLLSVTWMSERPHLLTSCKVRPLVLFL